MTARFGGEEFVALLPDTSPEAAHGMAERIRTAVEELEIEHTAHPIEHVTVSIGVATMTPRVGSTGTELLQLADKALYAAKRDGRNCVRAIAASHGYDASLGLDEFVPPGETPAREADLEMAEPEQQAGLESASAVTPPSRVVPPEARRSYTLHGK